MTKPQSPELQAILARLVPKGKPSPTTPPGFTTPIETVKPKPLAELLANAVPPPTAFEEAWERSRATPNRQRGVNPRKPWAGKGQMEVGASLPPMEKVKLQNAYAKAKAGRRLTLKERGLLGKHDLTRILRRARHRSGDMG